MMRRAVVAMLGLSAACADPLDQRLAIIDQPRVLAVIAEPAEARPGAMVGYSAVIASTEGPVTAPPSWAYCTAPKPPTEDNAVSTGCIDDEALIVLGTAPTVTGALPADGCIRFGPDVPPGGFRPRAADASGGYYQPVRVIADALLAFGLSRITCKLPTAPGEVALAYDRGYVANANPELEPVSLDRVPAETAVSLTAAWPASSVETYLYYDPMSQTLIDRREAMRVSWFATGGTIDVDASAVGEDDDATTVSTTWHTPAAGTAWLWFVLRDSRGGIAVEARSITVE
ncbi:MAG: hypothetical protein JWP01_3055 [Myxococcales bacterium]|nr:hypothetical protein [Myxococcales bacterium]